MVLDQPTTLLAALDRLALASPSDLSGISLVGDRVLATIVAIASDKYDWSLSDPEVSTERIQSRRRAAQYVIASVCFRPAANSYELLCVAQDASDTEIRNAYRRMIALVHPDVRPVGFPEDAASRVNTAYSLLCNNVARAKLDAELKAEKLTISTSSPSVRSRPDERQTLASSAATTNSMAKARLKAPRVSLLWIGVLLAIGAIAWLVIAIAPEQQERLVEARPAIALSSELGALPPAAPSESTQSETGSGISAAQQQGVGEVWTNVASKLSTDLRESRARAAGDTPQKLNTQPASVRSSRSAPAVESVVPLATPAESVITTSPPSSPPVATLSRSMLAPTVENATAVTAREAPNGSVDNIALVRVPGDGKESPSALDVDDMLLKFISAFESGSTTTLSRLFSPRMPGRGQLVAQYDRVFRETSARGLRLGQLKHRRFENRVLTSGLATVTTVTGPNKTDVSRVFLEIEVSKERDGLYIDRLATYAEK